MRKRYIKLNGLLKEMKEKKMSVWLDRVTLPKVLLFWLFMVVFFGLIYHFSNDSSSYLTNVIDDKPSRSLLESIYFSFMTSTTAAFGDIIPSGFFKLMVITEVIFGLLLLAIVTSKLVSIKQDIILNEIYEMSFNERINSFRSTLIMFKQNIDYMIGRIEEGNIKRREVGYLNHVYLSSFENTLSEINYLTGRADHDFIKKIDPVRIELLLNSIITSYEKISSVIERLRNKKLEWNRQMTISLLDSCISQTESIFSNIAKSKQITAQRAEEFTSRMKQETMQCHESLNSIQMHGEVQTDMKKYRG